MLRLPCLPPLLAWLLVLVPSAAAQVSVSAATDKTTMGADDLLTYTVEIRGAGRDLELPEAPSTRGLVLDRLSPEQRFEQVTVNGQQATRVRLSWTYRALRTGTARIEPLRVEVGGRTYRTAAIPITVVPQSQRPPPPTAQAPAPSAPSGSDPSTPRPRATDLFIRTEVGTPNPYVGQQVVVDYVLYFNPQTLQPRESQIVGSLDAEGLWREDLDVPDREGTPRPVAWNGQTWQAVTLKRLAVFPTRDGTVRLRPYEIEIGALRFRERSLFPGFGSLFDGDYVREMVEAPGLTLQARALPPGAPPSFMGAVGAFTLRAQVTPREAAVGTAVQVRVDLTGTGNTSTLQAPALTLPPSFARYDPTEDKTFERDAAPLVGRKTFTYTFVPRRNGIYDVPALTWSYFDPASGTYRTLTTDATALRITGTNAATPDAPDALATDADWQPLQADATGSLGWLLALLATPPVVLGGLVLVQRRRSRPSSDAPPAQAATRARLLAADGTDRERYARLDTALRTFLAERLAVPPTASTSTYAEALRARDVPSDLVTATTDLLATCARVRYAPPTLPAPDAAATARAAADLLADLDRTLPR